jgi:ribonuclease HII
VVSKKDKAGSRSAIPTLEWERELAADADYVLGIDEVGRGCLAGPVALGVAAVSALRLTAGVDAVEGVRDSKKLTPHRREVLLPQLQQWCDAWAVGWASSEEIDQWGISHCLGLAALRGIAAVQHALQAGATVPVQCAVCGIGACQSAGAAIGAPGASGAPDERCARFHAILDGPNDYITPAAQTVDAPALIGPCRVSTRVKADMTCALVSTASVIAKVTRDRYMTELAEKNPQWAAYDWADNKGYGTAAHRAAIANLGPTPYHRRTWHLV